MASLTMGVYGGKDQLVEDQGTWAMTSRWGNFTMEKCQASALQVRSPVTGSVTMVAHQRHDEF
ncbi:hypothetical protein TIFTF001_031766 [Ficus carica]|uniref:Uncharacterized protein n=1 Tax=Ficus carica TaxID=3494 RepID=A0AA88DVU9_FICCA|nr:hypothetical protein TIFTF001_031766 [Ficus carica]